MREVRGRKCARCGERKNLSEFGKRDSKRYYKDCKECKPHADAVKQGMYFEMKEKERQEKKLLQEAREQLAGTLPEQIEQLTAIMIEVREMLAGSVCMVCGGRNKVSYNGNFRPPRRCKGCWT